MKTNVGSQFSRLSYCEKVIAKTYAVENGHVLLELVSIGRGLYIVARNGQIEDARQKLTYAEAQALARAWQKGGGQ